MTQFTFECYCQSDVAKFLALMERERARLVSVEQKPAGGGWLVNYEHSHELSMETRT